VKQCGEDAINTTGPRFPFRLGKMPLTPQVLAFLSDSQEG